MKLSGFREAIGLLAISTSLLVTGCEEPRPRRVPMCRLAAIGGVWLRGMDNNIFTQIGFVVLAGLSAKNAVLIVRIRQAAGRAQPQHGLRQARA